MYTIHLSETRYFFYTNLHCSILTKIYVVYYFQYHLHNSNIVCNVVVVRLSIIILHGGGDGRDKHRVVCHQNAVAANKMF